MHTQQSNNLVELHLGIIGNKSLTIENAMRDIGLSTLNSEPAKIGDLCHGTYFCFDPLDSPSIFTMPLSEELSYLEFSHFKVNQFSSHLIGVFKIVNVRLTFVEDFLNVRCLKVGDEF